MLKKVMMVVMIVLAISAYVILSNTISEQKAEMKTLKEELSDISEENEKIKETNEVYLNRITEMKTEIDDLQSALDAMSILPVNQATFYAGDEVTSGPIGASGNRLVHDESVALNKPLMDSYGLDWGDTIVVRSDEHPELNGTYILEDCGVGCNQTIDLYLESKSMIPSYGRAHDLKVYAISA